MKDKSLSKIYFNSSIDKFEKIKNTGFVLGRARIAYAGANRNGSNISRDTFDSATNTLALVPIVGNWISSKNNFGGHDYAIEENGNSIEYVDKTVPYGVVLENHNAEWVDVEDDNGNIKKYVECDIVLWHERYQSQVQKIIDGGVNQSMEIIPTKANWNDETGLFDIEEFYYSALCLLGRDEDSPDNTIEPCFEDAQITAYQFNLDENEFKSEFNIMMEELKQNFASEGGESVDKNKDKKDFEEVEETVEEVEEETVNEEIQNDTEEIIVDTSKEETAKDEVTDENLEIESTEDNTETPTEEEKFTKVFELSHDDIRSKLYKQLIPFENEDDEWYWINEVYDDYFIYSSDYTSKYFKQNYIKTDVDVALEGERVELFVEYLTANEVEELKKMRKEYQSLLDFKAEKEKEEFELKQAELRQEKIDHINTEYTNISNDVKELFISKVDEYETVEDIDSDICVYIVKNKVNFSRAKKESTTVKVSVEENIQNPVASPYGDLF